jgi:hypothetical protein
VITLPLEEMSRAEKLTALEALWEDLSRDEQSFESPSSHAEELKATELRVASGAETFIDWAKKQLYASNTPPTPPFSPPA